MFGFMYASFNFFYSDASSVCFLCGGALLCQSDIHQHALDSRSRRIRQTRLADTNGHLILRKYLIGKPSTPSKIFVCICCRTDSLNLSSNHPHGRKHSVLYAPAPVQFLYVDAITEGDRLTSPHPLSVLPQSNRLVSLLPTATLLVRAVPPPSASSIHPSVLVPPMNSSPPSHPPPLEIPPSHQILSVHCLIEELIFEHTMHYTVSQWQGF